VGGRTGVSPGTCHSKEKKMPSPSLRHKDGKGGNKRNRHSSRVLSGHLHLLTKAPDKRGRERRKRTKETENQGTCKETRRRKFTRKKPRPQRGNPQIEISRKVPDRASTQNGTEGRARQPSTPPKRPRGPWQYKKKKGSGGGFRVSINVLSVTDARIRSERQTKSRTGTAKHASKGTLPRGTVWRWRGGTGGPGVT